MRINLVGPEATQRLEQLDVQRSDWKNRVTGYLDERDQITQSGMSDTAKQQAIAQLRSKHFNTPQEQLRAETFEHTHDQGPSYPSRIKSKSHHLLMAFMTSIFKT